MAVCDLTLKKIKRDIKRLDRKIKAAGRGSPLALAGLTMAAITGMSLRLTQGLPACR